jgi:hypothetical protein
LQSSVQFGFSKEFLEAFYEKALLAGPCGWRSLGLRSFVCGRNLSEHLNDPNGVGSDNGGEK